MQVINWADRASGPAIGDVAASLKLAPCGGINHLTTLPGESAQACVVEVHDAVLQVSDRPIIIARGCTYDPNRVPHRNLQAVRRAVEEVGRSG